MKIIKKINKAIEEDRPFWSFEYFPPKTSQGVANLYERMERMYELGPEFIDVTWGAGGSTSELTLEICATSQTLIGLETSMHLTCTNMTVDHIDRALKQAKSSGVQNILALRGDPPRGQEDWTTCENGFCHAIDLVKYIRKNYGNYFCISVAGYPEGHIDNPDKEKDLVYLKEKVDAGADFIVTQLFYDVELFLNWVQKCRDIGITCPILPGIMPIQNYNGFKRMTTLCKTIVPQYIHDDLEPIKEDDQAVKDYGVQLAIRMCSTMLDAGLRGFHFYTLNLERSVRLIVEGLFFNSAEAPIQRRTLPWKPSLAKNRENESVRPIFWANRTKSYVRRTETWDEFPNGRLGDSRSPAYGEIAAHGFFVKYTKEESLSFLGHPTSVSTIGQLFSDYIDGAIPALPWSDDPVKLETGRIKDQLTSMNQMGLLTINSQPAVNGLPSIDKVFGWGPKSGYVYQKAYLEFFVAPDVMHQIIGLITKKCPMITFHAVNSNGDLHTNAPDLEPNAVTWGVFPAKEIVQPTIVERSSFLAWKDEAFALWNDWKNLYELSSESYNLLQGIQTTWYLMNLVDNDYVRGDVFAPIQLLNS